MTSNRRVLQRTAIAATTALSLAVAGPFVAGSAQGAGTRTVHIKNIRFSPATLKITKGTTVRWLFEDKSTPHDVTSRSGARFKSSKTQQSGSYSVRFSKAGTYRYVCTIHFNMKASIVVR